jgi:hypothetical protein
MAMALASKPKTCAMLGWLSDEQLRFPLEAREAIGIARERVRDDFQRDVAVESGVARAVDLAHATGAEHACHFI